MTTRGRGVLGVLDIALLLAGVVAAVTVPGGGGTPTRVVGRPTSLPTELPAAGLRFGQPAWTNTSIHPVTSVVALGGRLLVYGSSGGSLTLYGLNPATGNVAWQQTATPSATTRGVGLGVRTVGDSVIYLRPDPGYPLGARLVAGDPATGADRWVGPPTVFRTAPGDCGDGANICANVHLAGFSVFSAKDGAARPLGLPDARVVGDGLLDLGGRSPELLAAMSGDAKILWSVPLASIFGPGHSTDGGWDFEHYRSDDIYVGSVGLPPPRTPVTSGPSSIDMTQIGTAGISGSTGRRLWFVPGSYNLCSGTVSVAPSPDAPSLPVLCRYAGTETYDPVRRASTLSGPTNVFGFDVHTGALTWQWRANDDSSLVNGETPHVQVDDYSLILPDADAAPFVVDLRSGASHPAGPTTVGWCAAHGSFTFGSPINGNPSSNQYAGGTLFTPCRSDGTAAPVPGQIPHAFAATAADVVAYASPTGVVAFHQAH